MQIKNTRQQYGSIAKFFHWTVFLLIAGLLMIGFLMTDMSNGPDKFKIYNLHKSTGIVVLMLALLRLGWKMANVTPFLPEGMHTLEKLAARIGHIFLYVLMIAMPLSGWLMSSAFGIPVSVYGWFTLPDLVAPDKELAKQLRELHDWMACVILVMVSLHVLAALLHHYYYKNNILRRMSPFSRIKDV